MVVLPTITLTPKKKQSVGSKALDYLSATMLEPTTFIKSPSEAAAKVKKRREDIRKTGDVSKALDIVGETLTSTLVAGGLVLGGASLAAASEAAGGGLAGISAAGRLAAQQTARLVPKTIGGKISAVTGAGILTTSPTVRRMAGTFLQDPTKIGREGGILIEKAIKGEDLPGIGDVVKTAGIVGAAVVGAVGAKKAYDKYLGGNRPKTPDPSKTPSNVPTSSALPNDSVPDSLAPIADTPVVASTPKPEMASAIQAPDINVKVINKPQVNVAVAQSI